MRTFLGLLPALAAATTLLALTAGQALADHVQCGDVITHDTTLDSDVVGPNCHVQIAGHDLTFDLNGHTITGVVGNFNQAAFNGDPGQVDADNNAIENGAADAVGVGFSHHVTVRNMILGGIEFSHADGSVLDNRVHGPGGVGGTGIGVSRGDLQVSGNVVRGVTGFGIAVDRGGATLNRNYIADNGAGVEFSFASGPVTKNIITRNSGNGLGVSQGGVSAVGNTITRNAGNGFLAEESGRGSLSANDLSANALDGVHIGADAVSVAVSSNTADRNGDDGIDSAEIDTPLSSNHTWFNGDLGIEAVPGTLGGDNWAKHNGNPAQCVPSYLCSATGKPTG
jgi:Right handed beta helix region